MKMRRLFFIISLMASLAGLANAELLVSESFDYEPDSIDGTDGGTGWGDIWIESDFMLDNELFALEVIEPAEPLIYAFPDGGFVNGGNRALQFRNDDPEVAIENEAGNALTRDFDEILDADALYFSFLYRYDGDGSDTGGFINDNDFVVWWFNSTGGPQIGLKGNGGNGSVVDDFVGRVNGAFAPPQQAYAPEIDISADAGTLNDTWLLVGKMSKSNHSLEESDFDQFDLWVNPGAEESAPNATAMGAESDALQIDFDSIGMRIFSEEPGDKMSWDELRIGETWEDVVSPLGDQDVVVAPTCTVPDGGILGDLDGDTEVGFSDFLLLSGNFGKSGLSYAEGDIDCDGDIAFADFLTLSGNFGKSAAGAQSVPEPSGLGVFLPIILVLIRQRRK